MVNFLRLVVVVWSSFLFVGTVAAQMPPIPPIQPMGVTRDQASAAINAATAANASMVVTKNIARAGIAALPSWWAIANPIVNNPNRSAADRYYAWALATECDRIAVTITQQSVLASQYESSYSLYITCAYAQFINPNYAACVSFADQARMSAASAHTVYALIISDVDDIIDLYTELLLL